jgi:hypothetical protein
MLLSVEEARFTIGVFTDPYDFNLHGSLSARVSLRCLRTLLDRAESVPACPLRLALSVSEGPPLASLLQSGTDLVPLQSGPALNIRFCWRHLQEAWCYKLFSSQGTALPKPGGRNCISIFKRLAQSGSFLLYSLRKERGGGSRIERALAHLLLCKLRARLLAELALSRAHILCSCQLKGALFGFKLLHELHTRIRPSHSRKVSTGRRNRSPRPTRACAPRENPKGVASFKAFRIVGSSSA